MNTPSIGDQPPDSPLLWFWWVLASALGWSVGGSLGVAAAASQPDIIISGYVGIAAGGMLAGVLQWLVLKRYLAQPGSWMTATIGAVAIVGVVVFGLGAVNADMGWVTGVGLFGMVIGTLHWRILRHLVARSIWWVAASTVGWVMGGIGGGLLGLVLVWEGGSTLLSWAMLGAVYGAVTGATLVWLLRRPLPVVG